MKHIMRCPSDKMLEKVCAILDKNTRGVFKLSTEEIRYHWEDTDLKYHGKQINY